MVRALAGGTLCRSDACPRQRMTRIRARTARRARGAAAAAQEGGGARITAGSFEVPSLVAHDGASLSQHVRGSLLSHLTRRGLEPEARVWIPATLPVPLYPHGFRMQIQCTHGTRHLTCTLVPRRVPWKPRRQRLLFVLRDARKPTRDRPEGDP